MAVKEDDRKGGREGGEEVGKDFPSPGVIKYHYNFPLSAYYSTQSIWAYIL